MSGKAKNPHINNEAERAVLGALLIADALDRDLVDRVLSQLEAVDFYEPKHATMFTGIRTLYAAGKTADVVLLDAWLTEAGKLREVGQALVHELADTCVSLYQVEHYAEVVLTNAVARHRFTVLNDAMLGKITDVEMTQRLAALSHRLNGTARARSDTQWRPTVQSARELMGKQLPPVRWVVEGLIAEGVTLLAAKPKKGKTVLMQNISISVSGGTKALGTLNTQQGSVLYLALEDNERRMQRRLWKMLGPRETIPDGLDLVYEWPPLDYGGLAALRTYLDEHADVTLVVVDILERVRPRRSNGGNIYADDYAATRDLQRLAGERQIAIVVIHHLRKGGAEDPMDEVSSSTGLTGGVDNILVMRPANGFTELARRGRDYEDDSPLAIRGDRDRLTWTLEGNAEEVGRSRERRDVLDTLRKVPDGLTPKELAEALGKKDGATRKLLFTMKLAGEVTKQDDGRYIIARSGNDGNGGNGGNDGNAGNTHEDEDGEEDQEEAEDEDEEGDGLWPLPVTGVTSVTAVTDVTESAQHNGHKPTGQPCVKCFTWLPRLPDGGYRPCDACALTEKPAPGTHEDYLWRYREIRRKVRQGPLGLVERGELVDVTALFVEQGIQALDYAGSEDVNDEWREGMQRFLELAPDAIRDLLETAAWREFTGKLGQHERYAAKQFETFVHAPALHGLSTTLADLRRVVGYSPWIMLLLRQALAVKGGAA